MCQKTTEVVRYLAIFPGEWGDEIRRVYKRKGDAIRIAKKHLADCLDCNTGHFAEVYECRMGHKRKLVFEAES